jgi:predicted DNA-binding protein with PD1-like motif
MKYSEAKQGRAFVIRLEDGDILHEELERFAREQDIQAAAFMVLGGADAGSMLIVGPEDGRSEDIAPMSRVLSNVYEACGVGTIFPDTEGNPTLHCHISCGRGDKAVAGCVRAGVQVWHVMEVILFELLESSGIRQVDPETGYQLLEPSGPR